MKAKDLRERTPEDLRELEKTISQDLFEARFKNFTNRLDDTSTLRKHRRELARIKTILAQSAKGGAVAAPKATESKPAVEAAPVKQAPAKKAAAPKKAAEPKAAKKSAKTATEKK